MRADWRGAKPCHRPVRFAKESPALGLHPRAVYDFFDLLVALGFLERDDQTFTTRARRLTFPAVASSDYRNTLQHAGKLSDPGR